MPRAADAPVVEPPQHQRSVQAADRSAAKEHAESVVESPAGEGVAQKTVQVASELSRRQWMARCAARSAASWSLAVLRPSAETPAAMADRDTDRKPPQ